MELKELMQMIPEGEIVAVRIAAETDVVKHVITRASIQDGYKRFSVYKLYDVTDNKLKYTGHESNSPLDLEEYVTYGG